MTQNPLTSGKKHLKSNSSILTIHISLPPFHASTRTKGSSIDFSLHLRNPVSQLRVTPCWMKSTPSTAASLQPSFASQLSSTQQLVWAPWRLAKQTAARNGERRFDVLWPLSRPQVVEPLVTIHLYQVSSTDEITQVKNKIMIASIIDAGVSFSGPSLWSWVSSDRVFASLYRLYLCQWTGTFCSFAVAGRNQFHMRRLAS